MFIHIQAFVLNVKSHLDIYGWLYVVPAERRRADS